MILHESAYKMFLQLVLGNNDDKKNFLAVHLSIAFEASYLMRISVL